MYVLFIRDMPNKAHKISGDFHSISVNRWSGGYLRCIHGEWCVDIGPYRYALPRGLSTDDILSRVAYAAIY